MGQDTVRVGGFNPLFEADMYAETYFEMKSLGFDMHFHPTPNEVFIKAFEEDERQKRENPNVISIGYWKADEAYLTGDPDETSDPVRAERLRAFSDYLRSKVKAAQKAVDEDNAIAKMQELIDKEWALKEERERRMKNAFSWLVFLCTIGYITYIAIALFK